MSESKAQLSKHTAIFAGGTLLSRVMGLAREVVITALIPTGSRDAFIVAFRLPNMLRDLVGEGASNAAFVPVLSEALEKESSRGFRELTSALMSAMILILGALTVLGILFIPYVLDLTSVLHHVTGRKHVGEHDIAFMISLARWTFPYIFLIGMTVFAMGPLFIMKHYGTPSWSPALLNAALIGTCLAFRDDFPDPAYALVLGIWLGGLAQLLVQYAALRKHAGAWLPNFHLRHPGVRTALWLLVPVLFGQAAGEVNKLADTLFAASLEEGVVSALYYANRLVQLPLSVFGIAISAAILPAISRSAARGDVGDIRGTLMYGLRQCFFLVAPALAALIVLHGPIVALLFQRGHFGAEETARTATALVYYAGGLLCFAWVKIAVAGFYAVKDTKTPVIIASMSMCLNIALNIALIRPMGFRGLALATTLSYSVNFLLLYLLLGKRFGALWDRPFASGMLRIALAVAGMTAVLLAAAGQVEGCWPHDTLSGRAVSVLIPLAAAGAAYMALCLVLRVPELRGFLSLLKRRGS